MSFKKLLIIIVAISLICTLLDLAIKLTIFTIFPEKVILNNISDGIFLFTIKSSYFLSVFSFFCGLIVLNIGRFYLSGSCLKLFATGLGFILGALIQAFESLVFPIIDFIPVHGYLLFDFTHGYSWCYANLADFYKPIGITLMCIGTANLIKEVMPRTAILRSTSS